LIIKQIRLFLLTYRYRSKYTSEKVKMYALPSN
jgi:hypothetical protein